MKIFHYFFKEIKIYNYIMDNNQKEELTHYQKYRNPPINDISQDALLLLNLKNLPTKEDALLLLNLRNPPANKDSQEKINP